MKLQQAIKILESHNKWRRGAEIRPKHPITLGKAIDLIIKTLKK